MISDGIRARIDEDETVARAVQDNSSPWDGQWQPRERNALETRNGWVLAVSVPVGSDFGPGIVEHLARFGPARMLRETRALRKLLAAIDKAEAESTAVDNIAIDSYVAQELRRIIAGIWSDAVIGATLTSADPEPPSGTVVRDDLGRKWGRDWDGGAAPWTRTDATDDPESWTKVAGNYGPVTVVEVPGDDG